MITAEHYQNLGQVILEINRQNGWNVTTPMCFAKPHKIGCIVALIQSELSEALEAARKGDRENFVEELADAKIRILDCLAGLGVRFPEDIGEWESDLPFVDPADWDAEYRVGSLLSKIGAKLHDSLQYWADGHARNPNRFAEALLECMIAIGELSSGLDMDLEHAMNEKLEKNRHRGFRHGGKKF